ncbi:hypothetical protein M8C21_018004, partial [Ambrosia artemisiifolia]
MNPISKILALKAFETLKNIAPHIRLKRFVFQFCLIGVHFVQFPFHHDVYDLCFNKMGFESEVWILINDLH